MMRHPSSPPVILDERRYPSELALTPVVLTPSRLPRAPSALTCPFRTMLLGAVFRGGGMHPERRWDAPTMVIRPELAELTMSHRKHGRSGQYSVINLGTSLDYVEILQLPTSRRLYASHEPKSNDHKVRATDSATHPQQCPVTRWTVPCWRCLARPK